MFPGGLLGGGLEEPAPARPAARADRIAWIDRFDFYDRGREVFAVLRTLETRKYGCVMLRKGVVEGPGSA